MVANFGRGIKQSMGVEKIQDDVVITPRREKSEKTLPANGIFLPNPGEARSAIEALKSIGSRRRFLFHSSLYVSLQEDLFVAGPAIGAPMAAMSLEKIIALGAKRVVLVSCCGGLDPGLSVGDIVLPSRALSGEGTAKYYQPEAKLSPDDSLVDHLAGLLTGEGLAFHKGVIWSTDAPYRERRGELKSLQRQHGVSGVDMEFSALCAVANFRGISFAGVFVVSDLLLADQWQPGFNNKRFRHQSKTLTKLLLTNFQNPI